jgi:CMP-N,N'-diacetyllegionaminic acid synthase
MKPRVLGVIVARGGSKRLPGKHLRPLAGKPLLAWTVEAAREAASLTRCLVSTDSPDIARCAAVHGGEVPFLRPPELATDTASPLDVLRHALGFCEAAGERYDAVALLQATSPFRRSRHIDEAVALFFSEQADAVTAIRPVQEHGWYQCRLEDRKIVPLLPGAAYETPRHQLPEAFLENGAIYVLRPGNILAGRFYGEKVLGYRMEPSDSVDIDTMEDFLWAEFLLSRS